MGSIFRPDSKTKIYKGKNGYTASFTKIRVNEGSKWVKSGGGVKVPRKKK